jgi:hypothetical protein
MALNFLVFWQLLHTAESYHKYNVATLAHDNRSHIRYNYFIFRMFPNTVNYIDVSISVLEYTWQINTFTFQRPSSSISRARGVSFTRHSCVWVVYLIHTEQSNGHIFGYGNEETRSYVYTTVVSLRLIIINNWPINHIVVWTIVSNKISFDTKKCIIWLQIMSFLIGRRP